MVSLWSLYFAGTLRTETLSYFWVYLWLGLSPNGVTEAEALASILHPAVTQTSPYTRSSVSNSGPTASPPRAAGRLGKGVCEERRSLRLSRE